MQKWNIGMLQYWNIRNNKENGPIYKILVKWYPIEIGALGFDPGIELTTLDSFL